MWPLHMKSLLQQPQIGIQELAALPAPKQTLTHGRFY